MNYFKNCIITIIFFGFIYSCENKVTVKNNFEGFYDKDYKQIRMKGVYINGKEDSLWSYYDETGKLVQLGSYKNGLKISKWNYKFLPLIDTTISWMPKFNILNKLDFSLPSNFIENKEEGNKKLFVSIDTNSRTVFTIKLQIGNNLDQLVNNEISDIKNQFNLGYVNCYKFKNEANINREYYTCFYTFHDSDNIDCFLSSMLIKYNDEIIEFCMSNQLKDSTIGKLIFGDIMQNVYLNEQRLTSHNDKIIK